jgi:hypothetical protein
VEVEGVDDEVSMVPVDRGTKIFPSSRLVVVRCVRIEKVV